LLRAGLQQRSVHILDISATGFAVACPEDLKVFCGQLLKIRVTEGWYNVRVARIGPLEANDLPLEYDCALGLERLEYEGYGPDHIATGRQLAVLLCGGTIAFAIAVTIGIAFPSVPMRTWQTVRSMSAALVTHR
jgi:hypothetical protein